MHTRTLPQVTACYGTFARAICAPCLHPQTTEWGWQDENHHRHGTGATTFLFAHSRTVLCYIHWCPPHWLQIELALAPFCSKLAELGRPYKMLRALRWRLRFLLHFFLCLAPAWCWYQILHSHSLSSSTIHSSSRRLLFLASELLLSEEATSIEDSLPYSYTLNYLFSRGPLEMKSPHQVS